MKKIHYYKMLLLDPEKVREHVNCIGTRVEKIYPEDNNTWFDCSDSKTLRICLYSDLLLKINIVWSFDGKNKAMTTQLQSTSIHRSLKCDVLSRYFKIQVLNESGKENKELFVDIRLIGKSQQIIVQQIQRHESPRKGILKIREPEEEEEDPEKFVLNTEERRTSVRGLTNIFEDNNKMQQEPQRGKSPFQRFRQKVQGNKDVPIKDKRLPEILFKGGILYVDKHKQFKLLPAGECGQVLKMDEDKIPCWVWDFPPKQMSDESKKKFSETLEKLDPDVEVSKIPLGWFEN